jgi:hypothetical protein
MARLIRFLMRDTGMPVHIGADFVEQVRITQEHNATAIYLSGKTTPILVEESLDQVITRLRYADESADEHQEVLPWHIRDAAAREAADRETVAREAAAREAEKLAPKPRAVSKVATPVKAKARSAKTS